MSVIIHKHMHTVHVYTCAHMQTSLTSSTILAPEFPRNNCAGLGSLMRAHGFNHFPSTVVLDTRFKMLHFFFLHTFSICFYNFSISTQLLQLLLSRGSSWPIQVDALLQFCLLQVLQAMLRPCAQWCALIIFDMLLIYGDLCVGRR